MINVLVLAIISAISPAILAVVIVVLSRPNPRRLLLAYLLGGMLASVAIGIAIVSTPEGVLTGYEARRRGIGGEVLCTVW